MTAEQTKNEIKFSLQAFESGNLTKNALKLFQTLGYVTERQAPLHKPTFAEFKDTYIGDKKFDEIKAKVSEWKFVDLLFQLSKEEVLKQTSLFDTKKVITQGETQTVIETYLFFAIELSPLSFGEGLGVRSYSRTELSLITREVNRLFPMPAMILFRHGNTLTLSVINRRLHKKDESKDVLEKVTQIKDINIENPHRAHIEILFDLSFDELKEKHQFTNFVELHNAWQKTLDTKLLNKKFFEELSNWYFWTQSYVEFPNDKNIEEEKNIQINLIRLITRLIFVWFLKEKKLVPEKLFVKREIKKLLKSFDSDGEKTKTYYTAILQNLFFATLNQKMNERSFIVEGKYEENKNQYGVKTLYRYADQFNCGKDEVINLFKDIPFLNGGLFDCLDKENEDTGKVEYIDGFSRNAKKVPAVPDLLFFGRERIEDLSEGYGYKRTKEKCRGLLEIFGDYKFTIEENTPIEEEIALDPELLGKVFENLLAYYNPETENTARKQTGSFYTPREIVNYMVDESLIAYLKTQLMEDNPAWLQLGNLQTDMFGNEVRKGQLKLEQPLNISRWKDKKEELENNLRKLIAYTNDEHPFTDEEDIQHLIYAIDHCKILDPACGSGAFPMGILHKLVYVLGKIDSDNVRWRQLQKRKAQNEIDKALNDTDKKEREKKLIDINENFEDNASDYGRKLYLIENCIYGVDIQPIAVQISKLRFFISLVVDQKEKKGENRGIRPLPNLETKFVAANTLVGLEKPAQLPMGYHIIEPLQDELQDIRHRHFDAKSRKDKLKCQKEDKAIRKKIAEQLKSLGFGNKDADKIARFDIYDQNISSDWFEPEWMFGKDLAKGFDIIIGNPPYINTKRGIENNEKEYFKKRYKSASGQFDIFCLFIENALSLGKIVSYIVPKPIINNENYLVCRKLILENGLSNVVIGSHIFESAGVESCIFVCNKKNVDSISIFQYEDAEFIFKWNTDRSVSKELPFEMINTELSTEQLKIVKQVRGNHKTFEKILTVTRGIESGKNDECITKIKTKHKLLRGEDVTRYNSKFANLYVNYDKTNLSKFKPLSIYEGDKILIRRVGNELVGTFDSENYLTLNTIYNCKVFDSSLNLYCLLGIINSTLIKNWFKKVFVLTDKLFPYVRVSQLNFIPIKLSNEFEKPIEYFVKYVLLSRKTNSPQGPFFERLIDAMVYELYLSEEIKSAGCEVLKHLNNLPELKEGDDEKNLKTIDKVYKELSDPEHPVTVAMFKMDTIEEIAIIEGKK